ncbi:MAG: hypothetical protein QXM81_06550 [Nitrososphaerota archaeon]
MGEETAPRALLFELADPGDLFRLASMLPLPFVNYSESDGTLFVALGGLGGTVSVYYVRLREKLNARFVHVNRLRGTYQFGEEASMEPNVVNVEVLRLKSHNLRFFSG